MTLSSPSICSTRAHLFHFSSQIMENVICNMSSPSATRMKCEKFRLHKKISFRNGLALASSLLSQDRMSRTRDNVKTAILVYASDYKSVKGKHFMTFILRKLKQYLVGIIGALCQVNCFCPNLWKQYTDNFQNGTWKYGECLRLGEIDAMWTAAKYSCHNLHHGGFLASEFSHQKHNFNSFMIKDDTTTSKPYMYHIGLSYDQQKGDYYWEQPVGMLPIQVGSNLGNDTQHEWSLGYPQVIGRSWCVLSAQTGTTFKLSLTQQQPKSGLSQTEGSWYRPLRYNSKRKTTSKMTVRNSRPTNNIAIEVEANVEAFIKHAIENGMNGLREECRAVMGFLPMQDTYKKSVENADKNRFLDVPCIDETRVILEQTSVTDSDYIHANRVKIDGVDRNFIMTQGPKENTIEDFWKMIFQV
uniref:Tyrosine-protein phosphatase domain-containing protein n=1 Tax=Heterorhabditis bacteriophora TaxID=37862 RepID=A0A1I7WZH7_HETBA